MLPSNKKGRGNLIDLLGDFKKGFVLYNRWFKINYKKKFFMRFKNTYD